MAHPQRIHGRKRDHAWLKQDVGGTCELLVLYKESRRSIKRRLSRCRGTVAQRRVDDAVYKSTLLWTAFEGAAEGDGERRTENGEHDGDNERAESE